MIFVATKNGRITKFSPSTFGAVVGSWILDPRSEILDSGLTDTNMFAA
jgi:hypothetical protein